MSKTITALASAALTAFSFSPAYGQEVGSDPAASRERAVAQCRQMSNAELQIACLEAALEAAYRLSVTSPSPEIRSVDSDTQGRQGLLSRINPFDSSEPSRMPQSGPPATAEGLGAEQVNRRQATDRSQSARSQTAASLSSRVTDTRVHGYASLVVALENGQVWRQISADTQRIDPDDAIGSPATVREGRINGYLLELETLGRTIRVERIR